MQTCENVLKNSKIYKNGENIFPNSKIYGNGEIIFANSKIFEYLDRVPKFMEAVKIYS